MLKPHLSIENAGFCVTGGQYAIREQMQSWDFESDDLPCYEISAPDFSPTGSVKAVTVSKHGAVYLSTSVLVRAYWWI